jgi:hypothetical protein
VDICGYASTWIQLSQHRYKQAISTNKSIPDPNNANDIFEYVFSSEQEVLLWCLKWTDVPNKNHDGNILTLAIVTVQFQSLSCSLDQRRTQQTWRTDLLYTWGIKGRVSVLFRPPISYRHRSTVDSLLDFRSKTATATDQQRTTARLTLNATLCSGLHRRSEYLFRK